MEFVYSEQLYPKLKKLSIFCESDPNKEPRVIRTIEALAGAYEITICGYSAYQGYKFTDLREFVERKEPVKFHLNFPVLIRKPISALLNIFYYSKSDNILNPLFNIKKAVVKLKSSESNVIICHGLGFLQLCSSLKTEGTKLILNAHEYYPSEFEDKPEWKSIGENYKLVLKKCAIKIDLIFAVSQTIGKRYKDEFQIPFVEIVNAPDYEKELTPVEVSRPIKLIHHGVALRNRKIELMIEAVLKSEMPFEFSLILVPTEIEYYNELVRKYSDNENIVFNNPVSVKQIASEINKYDIGIFYLEPVNYNWLQALPNKLFEFIQARLAIIVSPNPAMKKIVEEHNLGWVTKEFSVDSLINTLKEVTSQKVAEYKLNSHKSAELLSSQAAKEKMLNSVNQLCAA